MFQLAVLAKILLEGIEASAHLYGKYVETYLYNEEEITCIGDQEIVKISETKNRGYDVTNFFKVLFFNIFYIIICPFKALQELYGAAIETFIRDFQRTKNNQVSPRQN